MQANREFSSDQVYNQDTSDGIHSVMTGEKGRAAGREEQLHFGMFIARISNSFINVPADRIDSEIENAQRQICEYLDLDLCAVWQQMSDDQDKVIMTHLYPHMPNTPEAETFNAAIHYPWFWGNIREGKDVRLSTMLELPLEATIDRKNCELFGVKSNISLPLSAGGGAPFGVLAVNMIREERNWTDEIVMQLHIVAQVFANAIQRKRNENQMRKHIHEIEILKEQLETENIYLKDQLVLSGLDYEIVGESDSLKYTLFRINQVASTDVAILIEGETGTGKELVARALHKESKRKDGPFVKVNCASIPENLIESELFGHEKGAFTGAVEKRIGRFEIANGGTIFLDEIGELPINIQSKLLHVLQQGEFERIGSSKTIKSDFRVIAATNKVLEDEVKKGKFRNDLYYRLNVFPITVSSLRERKTDIPILAEYYTKIFAQKFNRTIKTISKKSMRQMMDYSWPGNIRELINVIERAIITSKKQILNIEPLSKTDFVANDLIPLEELEKRHIVSVLEKTNWKIFGIGGAASILKINPNTLRSKIKKLGIKRKITE